MSNFAADKQNTGVKKYIFPILLLWVMLPLQAQEYLTGVIIDADTGDSIASTSVVYDGHRIATVADVNGRYRIARHQGWSLSFSAVGYKKRTIRVGEKTRGQLNIRLKPDRRQLGEVKVKAKRRKYSRKNNPAVELMKRVVEAKKKTDLAVNDFYEYHKYEKLTVSLNDLKPEQLAKKPFSNHQFLMDQIEVNAFTNKLTIPVSVDETVSRKVYRKKPRSEKTYIEGRTSSGVNDMFQTGDIINTVVKDVFTDIDLYEDQIRLLQRPFTSPISKEGLGFYRYYIEDTLQIGRDSCIHLHFLPNNQHDRGFRGDLYILNDSTLHVRSCQLTIPTQSNVNFVDSMQVHQEFERMDDGQWVLTRNDMVTVLKLFEFIQESVVVTRATRMSDYAFDELPAKLFKGGAKEIVSPDVEMRDTAYWDNYRKNADLTRGEKRMDKFVKGFETIKGFKFIMIGLKTLMENSIETSNPNYIDLCPITSLISRNFVDGWRTRLSLRTTANLNRHLFFSGYYARGWDSRKNYYNAEVTYSLNPKNYSVHEFPRRTVTLQVSHDVCSPGDHFLEHDKDNVFMSMKWAKVDKMMFYKRQQLAFEYETDWGLRAIVSGKHEENEGAGELRLTPLSFVNPQTAVAELPTTKMRTTEVTASLRYAPDETYINNKQRRRVINLDAPVFTLSHTRGFSGLLDGEYNYNYTEATIFKRFWLSSWGKADVTLKGGVQWDQVPFLLLIHPASNLSYFAQRETFSLVNNMEFMNDRYASLMITWDLSGRLFNRTPIIKRWHWREFIGVRTLWGSLSDKNNPMLARNAGSDRLMLFPEGVSVMDSKKPYVEVMVGIHNICKFFNIDYVRRLNYNELPTSPKWGLRYSLSLTF